MKKAHILIKSKFRLVKVGTVLYKRDNEIDLLFFDVTGKMLDEIPGFNPLNCHFAFEEPLTNTIVDLKLN